MIKYVLKGKIGMMTRMTEFGPPVMLVIAVVSFVAILAAHVKMQPILNDPAFGDALEEQSRART